MGELQLRSTITHPLQNKRRHVEELFCLNTTIVHVFSAIEKTGDHLTDPLFEVFLKLRQNTIKDRMRKFISGDFLDACLYLLWLHHE